MFFLTGLHFRTAFIIPHCFQVRIWFCNRRQRQKKITQMLEREFMANEMNNRPDSLIATISAVSSQSSSETAKTSEASNLKETGTPSLSYALAATVMAKRKQSCLWSNDDLKQLNGSLKKSTSKNYHLNGQ